jgi:hypothetical protein
MHAIEMGYVFVFTALLFLRQLKDTSDFLAAMNLLSACLFEYLNRSKRQG